LLSFLFIFFFFETFGSLKSLNEKEGFVGGRGKELTKEEKEGEREEKEEEEKEEVKEDKGAYLEGRVMEGATG
jgi:hypothetical protein